MLLKYRDTQNLASQPWHVFDVRASNTEIILRRIVTSVHDVMGTSALEIFSCEELTEVGWIYIRCRQDALSKLKRIHGLAEPTPAEVPSSYVDTLIERARERHEERKRAIHSGSFVRIRDGFTRGYCGTVVELARGIARVKIELVTRSFFVRTPVGNLIDLSHVAEGRKKFYCSAPEGGELVRTKSRRERSIDRRSRSATSDHGTRADQEYGLERRHAGRG